MFPVIAIGAAIAGAFTVLQISSSSPSERKSTKQSARLEPAQVESPQSYVVTPLNASQARQITPLEAVRNFII